MCLCYLDDIIVFSPTFDEHVRRLELVLRCLSKAGLVLNPDKCLLGTKRLSIFGNLVDGEGVHPDPGKVDAMSKFPTPKSLTDVRSFIGMCSYYRRFIKNFAQKAEPLHRKTKNNKKKKGFHCSLFEKLTSAVTSLGESRDGSQPIAIGGKDLEIQPADFASADRCNILAISNFQSHSAILEHGLFNCRLNPSEITEKEEPESTRAENAMSSMII
ncbi:K02A2.6-like [Cordylochernes scorpioides]|uniref:K02A2.6-like n=1 Tax=Cordylochernes scorpioides TaxID=51811 RepID=A0ABY6KNA5_9ARAC|nr:K02A2.6-like [Cordylochernes scorpioides]